MIPNKLKDDIKYKFYLLFNSRKFGDSDLPQFFGITWSELNNLDILKTLIMKEIPEIEIFSINKENNNLTINYYHNEKIDFYSLRII